jgi:hypothetical protein
MEKRGLNFMSFPRRPFSLIINIRWKKKKGRNVASMVTHKERRDFIVFCCGI